ncbi:GTPase HflX [Longibacter sp.]|uniref:GTPase HflX n=1 Tax=Longibacter sp. TaxID=2045415 RepID=UPI003EBA39CF
MYKPETEKSDETAILVGVISADESRWDVRDHLNELEQLARTAGADVVDRMTQSLDRPDPSTFLGSGKVKELKRRAAELGADMVVFDDDLSPVQVRNVEKEVNCKLLDRSGLILDIFASRAKTAAAKTQVELAQLDYLSSRLTRRWTHLSRQSGGIGTKGPGEKQIETDRRLIDKRMAKLREKLEKIDRQRTTQRKGRHTYTTVSLVGYTNAGKSTLMNALADDTRVLAEDRLFATLDATTRTVELDSNKEILLSDTVGFIRKLPHRLIESFKSTLDEVREADALVHVVDVTHPRFEDHMDVVNETLQEIDADDVPTLIVFNKVDAQEDAHLIRALKRDYPDASFVSALRGMGLEALKEDLLALIERDYVERVSYVPVTEPKTISSIHRLADVLSEEYVYAQGIPTAHGDGSDGATFDSPQAVARMHYRAAPRNAERIERMVQSFGPLRVIGPDGDPLPQDATDENGDATGAPDVGAVVVEAVEPPPDATNTTSPGTT